MAASQPGTSSLAQIADNRIFLFRLQMLIIDGGLTSLRNYVDQELSAQSTTLSACLASEKTTIDFLNRCGIITKVQYDLLYPSIGAVSTSDLDITLIICLMRNLKCFNLNKNFKWNISPGQSDTSIEADICRLKNYRDEICHISSGTGIQYNDFINKWKEIEQILLRIDKVYPVKNFQQTITGFQSSILDPKTEKRVTDEIEKWNKFDKAVETDLEHLKIGQVLKQTLEAFSRKRAEERKRDSDNKEELKTVNVKIAKIEKQLPTVDNYQQQKLDWDNAPQAKKRKAHDFYQDKQKVLVAKWKLGSIDDDEHEHEELLEKFRELVSSISDKCLDSILQTEVAGETEVEAETSFSETMNDQKKQNVLKMTQSPESVRKVILENFVALKKYMHPDPIIDCKTGFDLLSVTDRRNLMGKDITDKNHTILKKVTCTGVNGYEDFKERLKKTWQTKLLELIQCAEKGQDTKEIEDQLEKNAVLSPEFIKLKMEKPALELEDQRLPILGDEELKWKDCIKKKDVKAARKMLDNGNLPSPEELQFAVNNFTYSNETREIVKDICQRIEIVLQKEHEEIEYIKGCYKFDDPYKNVIFVIKTSSKPTTICSRYRLYPVKQNNKDTLKEMEGENCTGYQFEEMFRRACECLRIKSPDLMEAHSNLTRTSVELRKLQTPEKAVCIVFYVEAKGYIPIGENVLPEQIKYDDDTAFVTDVREGQCATAIAGPCDKHDDLKIGCKIVSNTDDAGTLGCFVNHPKDGLCAMSCAHVLLTLEAMKEVYKDKEKQNVEPLGTIKCFQPGEPDLCGEVCDIRLFGNINNCGMDIAFFKVDEKRKPKTTAFPDVPASRISPLISNGIEMRYNPKSVMQNSKTMEMTLSTQFVKYGMKSNLTSGTYQCSGGSVRLEVTGKRQGIFRYVLADQIEIRDKTWDFCKPGDSGAMVFVIDKNKELMAFGILTGRIGRITFVTPIWNILKEIGMPLPYVLAEPI